MTVCQCSSVHTTVDIICIDLTVSLFLTWPLLFTSTPVLRRKTTSSRQPSRLAHTSPSDSSSTGWQRKHKSIIACMRTYLYRSKNNFLFGVLMLTKLCTCHFYLVSSAFVMNHNSKTKSCLVSLQDRLHTDSGQIFPSHGWLHYHRQHTASVQASLSMSLSQSLSVIGSQLLIVNYCHSQ